MGEREGGIVHVTVSNHINYSTKHEKGRGGGGGSGPYITVLIPILGMGGGSGPYITVLLPILEMGGGS